MTVQLIALVLGLLGAAVALLQKGKFTMIAFYTNGKTNVRAYLQGSDWQLLSDTKERWYSTWEGNKRNSLLRAFTSFLGHDVNPDLVHGLKDVRG